MIFRQLLIVGVQLPAFSQLAAGLLLEILLDGARRFRDKLPLKFSVL
jgi:hypothetical protein